MPSRAKSLSQKADSAADLTAARRVFELEASAIQALAGGLDQSFVRAVDLLQGVTGRVVVSGMGKSGLIGRKIAATMASTGSPAVFVHPAEASHGDLGMIVPGDAVLCLSNSGETTELGDLIAHAKRFAIPLIGIVGRSASTLGEAADVTLLLPAVPEACPLGLAPTTSTTMMLALGDALSVALLERRGFTRDEFQVLHPGGKLGKALIKVSDVMHEGDELPLAPVGTGMREALLVITAKRFGCLGVTENGRLAGIITDGDLRRNMQGDLLDARVEAVMTRKPQTIRPEALGAEALNQMNSRNITSLFVVDAERPVGILHIHDLLRAGVA